MKGAARSVGADNLADLAAQLEDAASNGDAVLVEKATGGLIASLHVLTDDIRAALDEHFDSEPLTATEDMSAERLERLKSALHDMDIATVNELMMEYSALPLKPGIKRELSEIERLLLLFEYDTAIARISALREAV